MKMIKIKNKRGSTLVLALVLTMVLFIMGIAFISTTSIQRDMVENVGQQQFVNDGVDQVVDKIKQVLKDDLFETPSNYTGFLQGNASYDYPDENNIWLSSLLPEYNESVWDILDMDGDGNNIEPYYYYSRITDLWGNFRNDYRANNLNFPKRSNDRDTDSDGVPDTALFWLNYYYDPDLLYRIDTNNDDYLDSPYALMAFSINNNSWPFIVNGNNHTVCRTVDKDEPIKSAMVNHFINQWDNNTDVTSAFYTYLANAPQDVLDAYGVYYDHGSGVWRTIDSNCQVVAEEWYLYDNSVNPPVDRTLAITPPSYSPTGMRADADGDGVTDSRWVRLGRVGADNDYLYAAVRIIDNCGMINLNTAFRKPGQKAFISGTNTFYDPYDFSRTSTYIINNQTTVLDDWDGTSVSHIDALSLVRPIDFYGNTYLGYPAGYGIYYGLASNLGNGGYNISLHEHVDSVWADLLFATNKAGCPYRPKSFSVDFSGTKFFDVPTSANNYNFVPLELSDELYLRNGFFLQNNNYSVLKDMWVDTLDPDTPGFFRYSKYRQDETNNGSAAGTPASNFIEDYYEYNWNWFRKSGLYLTGNPANDAEQYPTGQGYENYRNYFSRRHIVTAYNKDRVVRPEYDTSSFPTSSGFVASDVLGGMRKCYVGPIFAGQDSNGDGINDEYTDLNYDRIADDWDNDTDVNDDPDDARIEGISSESLAAAVYMGLPGDAVIEDRFSDPGDKFAQKTYPLSDDNTIDYDRVLLAWQLALNMTDYQDVEGIVPSETAGAISYKELPGYNSMNHTIFGHENLAQIAKDTICISRMSCLFSLQGGTDDGLPNGSYYAIELFNPDGDTNDVDGDGDEDGMKKVEDLKNYDLIFVDKDNKIICKLNLEDLDSASSSSDRVDGSLQDLDAFSGSTSDSTFTLCFYSGRYFGRSKYVNPDDTEAHYNDYRVDVLDESSYTVSGENKFDVSLHSSYINTEFGIRDTSRVVFIGDKYAASADPGYLDSLSYAGKTGSTELTAHALFNLTEKLYIVKRDIDGIISTEENLPVDMVDFRAIEQSYDSRAGSSIINATDFFDQVQTYKNYHKLAYRAETWWGDTNYLLMPSYSTNGYDSDATAIDSSKSYNPWFCEENNISTTHILPPYRWDIGNAIGMPSVLSDSFDDRNKNEYPDGSSNTGDLIVQPITGMNPPNSGWWNGINNIKEFARLDVSSLSKVYLNSLADKFSGEPERYKLRNISQLQEVLAVGPRNVYNTIVDSGYEFYATTLFQALLRSQNTAVNQQDMTGKLDLTDIDFYGLADHLTAIDPSHDGIDNDGNAYTSDNPDGDWFDNDGDGFVDEADGSENLARYYESTIAGRININTAPWYVIARLPWVTEELAQAIVAYRDKKYLSAVLDTLPSVNVFNVSTNGDPWFRSIVDYSARPIDFVDNKGKFFPIDPADIEDASKYPEDFNTPEMIQAWQDWVGWQVGEADWDFDDDGTSDGPKNLGASRQWGMGKFNADGPVSGFNESKGFRNIAELLNVTHDQDNKSGIGIDSDYLGNVYSAGSDAEDAFYVDGDIGELPFNRAVGTHYNYKYDIQQYGKTFLSGTGDAAQNANGNYQCPADNSNFGISYNHNPFYSTDVSANDQFERDGIFSRISNLVTTRSDVFTAYILVRVGESGPQRRMIGIFDRSGVYSGSDEVRLVALYQVPEAE